MTRKREDREALITEAGEAILEAMGGIVPDELESMHADAAKAALAVFEQAHTPTDDEREALADWLRQGAPFDNETWGQYQDQLDFAASTIEALRRSVQGEPRCLVEHPFSGRLCSNPATSCDGHVCDITPAVQGELSAVEFREQIAAERLRQTERGYDHAHDREHGVDHLLVWAQDYARQGEPLKSAALIEAARELLARLPDPSRAALSAAIEAYKESARMHPGRTHMRAALRAAAAVTEQGGENRG